MGFMKYGGNQIPKWILAFGKQSDTMLINENIKIEILISNKEWDFKVMRKAKSQNIDIMYGYGYKHDVSA